METQYEETTLGGRLPAVTPLLDDRLDHDDDGVDDDDDGEGKDIFWGPIKERALFSDKSSVGHIAWQLSTVPCHEIRPLLLPTYHRFPHFAINQRPHPLSSYLHCAIKYCEEESGGQKVKATIFTSKS